MEKTTLSVQGMSCRHCEIAVTKAAEAIEGVKKTTVDLKKGLVTVEFDPAKTGIDAIKAAITGAGYEAA
jgi:copper chaperone